MEQKLSLISEIAEVVKIAPERRHSYFQLKHFIVNKEPTHQAKLWQCLRELESRKDAIESIYFEIEDANDSLALIDIREEKERAKVSECISTGKGDLIRREWEIKIRQNRRSRLVAERNLVKLKEKLAFLEQEARFFLDCFNKLSEIEPVKDFDDLEAQTEYWNERLSQEVTLRTLLQLPLDADLAKTILSLADEMPIKTRLVNSLQHISKQLAGATGKYLASIKEQNVQKETV